MAPTRLKASAEDSCAVQVLIRVRPSSSSPSLSESCILSLSPDSISISDSALSFTFDQIFPPSSSTEELYAHSPRQTVLNSLRDCTDCTLFAYGATGSGKTFTISSNPGILQLATADVFATLSQVQQTDFLIRLSVTEVYNEQIFDLLSPERVPLKLKMASADKSAVKIAGVEWKTVVSPKEVQECLLEAVRNRSTGKTEGNDTSSRSHLVFQLSIQARSDQRGTPTKHSVLTIVDLAGSEKASADMARRAEGANINKSLYALSLVISKLAAADAKAFIPYRDSVLTRLLQPALSGQSRIIMLVMISPDIASKSASIDSLKFGSMAKKIVTAPKTHLVTETSDEVLRALQRKIAALEQELTDLRTDKSASDANQGQIHKIQAEIQATQAPIVNSMSRKNLAMYENLDDGDGEDLLSIKFPNQARRVSDYTALSFGKPSNLPAAAKSKRIISQVPTNSAKVGSVEKELELEAELERIKKEHDISHALISDDVAELRSTVSTLKTQRDTLSEQLASITADAEREQAEVFRLAEELSEAHVSSAEQQRAMQAVQAQVLEEKKLSKEKEEMLSNFKASSHDHSTLIVTLEKSNAELESKMAQTAQTIVEFETQRSSMSEEILRLNTDNTRLTDKLALLEKEVQDLSNKLLQAGNSHLKEATNQRTAFETQLRSLKSSNAELHCQVEELNCKNSELASSLVEAEFKTASTKIEMENAVKATSNSVSLEKSKMDAEIKRLKEVIASRDSEAASHLETLALLAEKDKTTAQQNAKELQAAAQSSQELQETLNEKLEEESEKHQVELRALLAKHQQLQAEYESNLVSAKSQETKLLDRSSELDALETKLLLSAERAQKLDSDCRKYESEWKDASLTIAALEAQLTSAKAQSDSLKDASAAEKKASQDALEFLSQKNTDLEEQLSQTCAEMEELKSNFLVQTAPSADLGIVTERLLSSDANLEVLKKDIHELRLSNLSMEQELIQVRSDDERTREMKNLYKNLAEQETVDKERIRLLELDLSKAREQSVDKENHPLQNGLDTTHDQKVVEMQRVEIAKLKEELKSLNTKFSEQDRILRSIADEESSELPSHMTQSRRQILQDGHSSDDEASRSTPFGKRVLKPIQVNYTPTRGQASQVGIVSNSHEKRKHRRVTLEKDLAMLQREEKVQKNPFFDANQLQSPVMSRQDS